MAIPSKQIGWSNEANLLWYIAKELEQIKGQLNRLPASSTTTTTTTTTAPSGYYYYTSVYNCGTSCSTPIAALTIYSATPLTSGAYYANNFGDGFKVYQVTGVAPYTVGAPTNTASESPICPC